MAEMNEFHRKLQELDQATAEMSECLSTVVASVYVGFVAKGLPASVALELSKTYLSTTLSFMYLAGGKKSSDD